jgi:hypothetical protein
MGKPVAHSGGGQCTAPRFDPHAAGYGFSLRASSFCCATPAHEQADAGATAALFLMRGRYSAAREDIECYTLLKDKFNQ